MSKICVDCTDHQGHPVFRDEQAYKEHRADRHQEPLAQVLETAAEIAGLVLPAVLPGQEDKQSVQELVTNVNSFIKSTEDYMESINGHFASLEKKINDLTQRIVLLETKAPAQ